MLAEPLLMLLACTQTPVPAPAPPVSTEPAALLVWMPYDNDLHPAVGPVLTALQEGSAAGLPVAVQVDRPDQPGMELITFIDGVGATMHVDAEDSGSAEAFAAFLGWASARFEAERYGVVVLDHGGDLYHLARDDDPGLDGVSETWMHVHAMREALQGFDEAESGRVELVFLQVCGKASVEPLLALAPATQVILASQLPLAAPNTWYRDALPAIAAHPEWGGEDWAEAIATAEGPQMFGAYTCARSAPLLSAEGALADALSIEVTEEEVEGPLASMSWPYGGEVYTDLGAALRLRGQDPAVFEAVLCGHWRSPAPPPGLLDGYPPPAALSGLSVSVEVVSEEAVTLK